ncbi:MAG: hypothetical protein HN348_07475 [Proteobacteria bacterium]|jgi:hypothetical protein|nr:hypothetical protein [Pseudomonadota bacterium]
MRLSIFLMAFVIACQPMADSESLNDGSWDSCPTPSDFAVSATSDNVSFTWQGQLSDLIVVEAGTDWEIYDHLWALQCGADYVPDAFDSEYEIPPNCIEPPLIYGSTGNHYVLEAAKKLKSGQSYDMYGAWWCNDGVDYAEFHIDGPYTFTR